MGWTTSKETWTVTIHNPDDKSQTAEVVLRELNFGETQSLATISNFNEGGSMTLGDLQIRQIELSIVSWTIPSEAGGILPLNLEEIHNLSNGLGMQILAAIEEGRPDRATAATPEEVDKLGPLNGSGEPENVESVTTSA